MGATKLYKVTDPYRESPSIVLVVTGHDGYGPKKSNPSYSLNGWAIGRHKWSLPETRWAWRAEIAGRDPVYGDTLYEVAEKCVP